MRKVTVLTGSFTWGFCWDGHPGGKGPKSQWLWMDKVCFAPRNEAMFETNTFVGRRLIGNQGF